MVNEALGNIQLRHLLDTGLPEDAMEALRAESPVGLVSAESMTALIRDSARRFDSDLRVGAGIGDLIDHLIEVANPLDTATWLINHKYNELGASSGFLGSPTSAVSACADGAGFRRTFASGAIYWHPASGAHEVHGQIRAKWNELGAEMGFLGYPTSDQTPGRDAQIRGAFNHFRGGSIYWHPGLIIDRLGVELIPGAVSLTMMTQPSTTPTPPRPAETSLSMSNVMAMEIIRDSSFVGATGLASTGGRQPDGGLSRIDVELRPDFDISLIPDSSAGAYEVHGAILTKYLALGAEASILGYPTSDERNTQGGGGRLNLFEAGAIYWSAATGAAEIHALIREYWNAHGSNQGAFGFPISDELIPDRRLGHVRPETRRKPIANLPIDVIKLPADAGPLNFSTAVVNNGTVRGMPSEAVRRAAASGISAQPATRLSNADIVAGASLDVGLVTSVIGGIVAAGEASTAAPTRSDNRFEDFEGGVLFWRRGAAAATQVAPWLQASDGTKMRWSAAEIQAAAQPVVTRAFAGLAGLSASSLAFQGTTAYSFDGAGVHNRRHRFQVTLFGGMIGFIPMPVVIEVQIEASFDPLARKIVGLVANWLPLVVPALSQDPMGQLHRCLDPILWSRFDLAQLPDTEDGSPIAVLSVKTQPSGDVNIYIEPRGHFLGGHEFDTTLITNPGFSPFIVDR